MGYLSLGLTTYFALVLLVSGVAKLDDFGGFQAALYRQRVLPRSVVPNFSLLVPSLQILLAYCLVLGNFFRTLTALAVLVLFVALFANETILTIRGTSGACGCYGRAFHMKVDEASIVNGLVLVVVASINVAASLRVTAGWEPRGVPVLLVSLFTFFCLWVLWRHHQGPSAAATLPV